MRNKKNKSIQKREEQLKNNRIPVFQEKTAALIKDLQLSSCEKKREGGNQLPGGGGGGGGGGRWWWWWWWWDI